ncbi:hypothetical protein PUR59_01570 [Streptomyces sp. SP18ES09]|uniref:hypothetical protein n=1 Tax=Streptomyces sp. SP18ES09 TaxID=3002532 RepID=UPI002E784FA4|nr:hypothetical protein [Streptomyces sp. SP18ES09]MEE1813730.1 hypothetical protein [Streptomyces sp. SP18ES09]
MNTIAYYVLLALGIGVEIWGAVTGVNDVMFIGAIAAFGVWGVDRLLLRADAYEEFFGAGEER